MNLVELLDTKLTHRNLLHSYTPTTIDQEEKLRKQSRFTIASKRIKHLGINLPTEAKDLYSRTYKMLIKEMEDDTDR